MHHLAEFIKRRAFVIPPARRMSGCSNACKARMVDTGVVAFESLSVFHSTFRGHQLKTVWQGAKTP